MSLEIPISGDTSALNAAIADLKIEIRALAASISTSLAPATAATRKVAQGMNAIEGGARGTTSAMGGFIGKLSNAGAVTANIVAGAQAARTAFKFLTGASSDANRLATSQGQVRSGIKGIASGLRSVIASPAFRKIALTAVLAGGSILGIVAAVRVTKAAFRVFGGAARAVLSGIQSAAHGVMSTFRSLGSSIKGAIPGGGLLGPLAGIAGIAGSVALVTSQLKGAFNAASAFEDLEVSVSSFLGSTTAAKDLLAELQTFADKTPFATSDIQEAAAKLLGAGVRGNIAGLTKDLAGVAKNGDQLKELADALGKGFAKGKFQTEELNKFLERGINLLPALQQQTGLTGKAFQKAIEEGLGFQTVTRAISSMTQKGGTFFGLLERRSMTFAGIASTLGSVWDTVRRTFAQPILDAIKPILQNAISMVESFKASAESAGKAIGSAILAAFALIKSGKTFDLMRDGIELAVNVGIDLLLRGLKPAVSFLATSLGIIFNDLSTQLFSPGTLYGLKLAFTGMARMFGNEIRLALPFANEKEIAGSNEAAMNQVNLGMANMKMGSSKFDVASTLTDALMKGGMAGKEAFRSEWSPAVKESAAKLKDLAATVAEEVAKLRTGAAVPPPAQGATGESTGGPLNDGSGDKSTVQTLSTSLGRVGGGGFGITLPTLVSETRKSNTLLTQIDNGIQKLSSAKAIPVLS